ncbi:TPA_exp: putative Endo-1,3(4)-beta-glucanase [Trichophyton benhamiae CBS 112371]|uniref:Endo-1,3(4)-beta-glucanase, putative n=1 Tax=Arthroderma benhamiae (strain ATCC MYA-4681 / CBS 112371) TaxID=663331 RepID=D4AZT6_ARTBC|nr:endo-1,3(4)-beta-glucanase, putative [Trichophyton benhamiae CBS 112371]EFE31311.1 endo-1,3(4)-beta-glucanase, putative [Trichophyton benhamiae CBS 112371]DAA74484.1 TPA_exp: putative Endo-1,3(4)-beta-glucanase [Trichophyton benhamiae CBS 112371]
MVLNPQQTGFSDDSPPSDSDSYFSSSEYSEGGQLSRFAKYPTRVELPPFSLIKRIFYWTEANYQRSISRLIEDRLDFVRVITNRFPTQEETDALVSQASTMQNMPCYGGVVSLAVGSFIAKSKNAAEEAAAKKSASEHFTPNQNRPLLKLNPGELKGRLIRASFILPIFGFIGLVFGEVVGEAVSKVSMSTDPRLVPLFKEVGQLDQQEVMARIRRHNAERLAAARRQRNNLHPASQPQRPEYYAANDTSPTNSYGQQGATESSYYQSQPDIQAGYSNQSAIGDSKILRETYRQGETSEYSTSSSYPSTNDYSRDWRQQQTYPPARDSSTSSTEGKSFWDDDASPVSSEFTSTTDPSSSPAPHSGSAWARIRQQSMGDSSANSGNNNTSSSGW